jgi:hypothetical protein
MSEFLTRLIEHRGNRLRNRLQSDVVGRNGSEGCDGYARSSTMAWLMSIKEDTSNVFVQDWIVFQAGDSLRNSNAL